MIDLFGDAVPVQHANARADQSVMPFDTCEPQRWRAEEFARECGLKILSFRLDGTFTCDDGQDYAVVRDEDGTYAIDFPDTDNAEEPPALLYDDSPPAFHAATFAELHSAEIETLHADGVFRMNGQWYAVDRGPDGEVEVTHVPSSNI